MPINTQPIEELSKKAGAAAKSPFAYGADNIMNMFNQQMENQMKINMMMGQGIMTQNIQNEMDPVRKIENAKLKGWADASASPQSDNGESANAAPSASFSNKPSGASVTPGGIKPIQSQGSSSGMVAKSFTKQTGPTSTVTYDDPNYSAMVKGAEIDPQVKLETIKNSSSEAQTAALMMQKLDAIRALHDKAVSNPGVTRATATTKSPFGVATRLSQAVQGGQLLSQGPDNPEWQNYEAAKKNFSYAADRGLFGEKGKLIAQQLNAGVQLFPGRMGTKEGDLGLWKTLYSVPMKSIQFHNNIVDKYSADPSIKVEPNSVYQSADSLRDEAMDAIKRGASGIEVAKRFKQKTGMDF